MAGCHKTIGLVSRGTRRFRSTKTLAINMECYGNPRRSRLHKRKFIRVLAYNRCGSGVTLAARYIQIAFSRNGPPHRPTRPTRLEHSTN